MHPVLFQIGSFSIYTYGVCIALAVITTLFYALKRAGYLQVSKQTLLDLILIMFLGGIAGARLQYVIQHWDNYHDSFFQVINIREGGLVWYGGFIGGFLGGLWMAKRRKLPMWPLCDFFSPMVPAAQALGRLGCFFNGCCYGRYTHEKIGIIFPGDMTPRVPVQLIECLFLIGLSFLLFLRQKRSHFQGEIFSLYLFFYGAGRFFLEYLRADQSFYFRLTAPQWTSLILIGAGIMIYFRRGLLVRNSQNE